MNQSLSVKSLRNTAAALTKASPKGSIQIDRNSRNEGDFHKSSQVSISKSELPIPSSLASLFENRFPSLEIKVTQRNPEESSFAFHHPPINGKSFFEITKDGHRIPVSDHEVKEEWKESAQRIMKLSTAQLMLDKI